MKYNSYYLYQKLENRGGQGYIPVYPATYSIDGNGTQQKLIHRNNYFCCGEIPAIFRWQTLDINTDWWCEPCDGGGSGSTNYKARIIYDERVQDHWSGKYTWYHRDVYVPCNDDPSFSVNKDEPGVWVPTSRRLHEIYLGNCVQTIISFQLEDIKVLYMTDSVTRIESSSHGYWQTDELEILVLSRNLQYIGAGAFRYCVMLKDIDLSNTITYIGDYAFEGCHNLTYLNIPSGLTQISDGCFQNCWGLLKITIPDGVVKIGKSAFRSSGINYLECGSGLTTIEEYAFENCDELERINFNNQLTSIGDYAFANCSNLKSLTIPDSVAYIGNCAFQNCRFIPTLSLKVKPLSYAFANCVNLKSVTITNNVTEISDGCFQNCYTLNTFNLPQYTESIGDYAFQGCSGLTGDMNIPNTISSIGNYAFQGCSNISSFKIYATTPPTLGGEYVFAETNDCPIYVPAESLSAFKQAPIWNKIAYRIQAIQ